jgi:glycosyltransferase involved in cell wall biosynthesis
MDIELLPNVKILRLERNLGPGLSRDHAIRASKHNIVAIMDADDLCSFNRFERQLHELTINGVDVVGGFIEEFNIIPVGFH